MIKKNIRFIVSAVSLFSVVFMATVSITAAPIRFNQVTQVVNAKPGKASNGNYTRLRLSGNAIVFGDVNGDEDDKDDTGKKPKQDDRVIKETSVEIIEQDGCPCIQDEDGGGFPYWVLLGLGVIPFLFLIPDDDPDPTPTPTPPTTPTPTPSMTPTPTPPTEPIPEPMTILLFGTGLAGIGVAARKRFGRREDDEGEG